MRVRPVRQFALPIFTAILIVSQPVLSSAGAGQDSSSAGLVAKTPPQVVRAPAVSFITVDGARRLQDAPSRAVVRLGLTGTGLDLVSDVVVAGIDPPPVTSIVARDANLLAVDVTVPLDVRSEALQLRWAGGAPVSVPWASLAVSTAPSPTSGPAEVEVTVTSFPSDAYPSLRSIVLSTEQDAFVTNPNHMAVEIVPSGATNVHIRPGNSSRRLIVDYLAPEKFELRDVVVSVYDSSDLDRRALKLIGKTVKEFTKKQDANQPAISSCRLVSLRRYASNCAANGNTKTSRDPMCGFGLVRVEGKGFGGDPASVVVGILPRNPEILIIPESIKVDERRFTDKTIEAQFEFVVSSGYSVPMRLEGVSVSVRKPIRKTVRKGDLDVAVGQMETYLATTDVGPKRDGRLEYGYTILDVNTAHQIFGRGVATNFYVIALAVVNRSEKKIAIPLSGIEAEVEWAHGDVKDEPYEMLEGPATLRPVPLATVTAFFTADNRSKGRRAKLFNILEGIRTLAQTMIPLFGPGFETAHTIFTSGLIPGAKIAVGDLSDQQLQSLAGLSWENVEEVPGNGGSKVKFVFIQRGLQEFGLRTKEKSGNTKDVKKEIKNLYGVELTGFEILDTATHGGTPNKALSPQLPDK